ncbi:hypothetical protein MMG85_18090 [Pseudoxanthomonas sp. LH2527]|uniref:hypothetical protein n=1 Tax=Pseudoxanthomonas sp. LH2527 TaxID=2923249 RepID=UPI001F138B68|nr:hypothetical protein [Pseudoxanthomonas sp. LH2527]MCH6485465.1 hypothetical protein [Pseudoxanthomonas sp. LH2527]
MKKVFLYLIRLTTVLMAMTAILLSIPSIASLYFLLFKGAHPGDSLAPDAFVLSLHLSLAALAGVIALLWGAYVADRFAVSRLRALA